MARVDPMDAEYRAVVAVATTSDGTAQAVQRIPLDENGGKIGAEEMARVTCARSNRRLASRTEPWSG